jgi:hypothetical protein
MYYYSMYLLLLDQSSNFEDLSGNKYFIQILPWYVNLAKIHKLQNVSKVLSSDLIGQNDHRSLKSSIVLNHLGKKIRTSGQYNLKIIKQDWKFFHSLSREKKMSKLSKRLFFCNSWQAGTEYYVPLHEKAQNVPYHGTKRRLGLCATGRHKTKCATGRHKMCHTAQKDFKTYVPQNGTYCATGRHKNVPQHGTKRLMCHGKAQHFWNL